MKNDSLSLRVFFVGVVHKYIYLSFSCCVFVPHSTDFIPHPDLNPGLTQRVLTICIFLSRHELNSRAHTHTGAGGDKSDSGNEGRQPRTCSLVPAQGERSNWSMDGRMLEDVAQQIPAMEERSVPGHIHRQLSVRANAD